VKRREALLSLAATTLGITVTPELLEAVQAPDLTDEQVEALLRSLAKVEPRPGEAEGVRARLNRARSQPDTDPRLQPGFAFNPEVEL